MLQMQNFLPLGLSIVYAMMTFADCLHDGAFYASNARYRVQRHTQNSTSCAVFCPGDELLSNITEFRVLRDELNRLCDVIIYIRHHYCFSKYNCIVKYKQNFPNRKFSWTTIQNVFVFGPFLIINLKPPEYKEHCDAVDLPCHVGRCHSFAALGNVM